MLETLRIRYDLVIIDTPPVLSASETALIARYADATVMAVRWGRTSRDAAAVAVRKLHDAGALVAGSVITMVHERSEEHTSELQSLMRISYAVFCLKNKNITSKNRDQRY